MNSYQVVTSNDRNLRGIEELCMFKLDLESGVTDAEDAIQSLRNITMEAIKNLEMLLEMELDVEEKTQTVSDSLKQSQRNFRSYCGD